MNRRYRKTVITGNWKMNKLPSEVKPYAEQLKGLIPKAKWCEIAVCVPSVMLQGTMKAFKDVRITVGAQDISEHERGAYTGEVSASQVANLGVKYVIIGHSERRQYHAETDEQVNTKVHLALENQLSPIICVGESLEQREMGVTLDLINLQVRSALAGVSSEKMRSIIIAYEPIWAIGTGRTATAIHAGEVCTYIRSVIRSLHGARVARSVTIQYGGSMNADNAYELLAQPDIDGGLIGGTSLKPEEFSKIIFAANQDQA